MVQVLINIIPAIILAFLSQFFIHEIGHYIGGKISGWKLIYIQLYKIVLAYKGTLKIKKVDTVNFQCMMYPKDEERNPMLYTSFGCYANAVSAFLSFLSMLLWNDNMVIVLYEWCFFVTSLTLYLFNSIPNVKRLCNDGATYELLKADDLTCAVHNKQLLAAKYLYEGYSHGQIDENLICLPNNYAGNDILAYQAVLEYYHWLDLEQYELAKKALAKIDKQARISPKVMNIVCMEQLYLEVFEWIKKPGAPIDKERFGEDLSLFIHQHGTPGDIHTERVRAVLDIYFIMLQGNGKSLYHILVQAEEKLETMKCSYPGEQKFCKGQLKQLRTYMKPLAKMVG